MAITGKVESGGVSVSAEVDSAHEVPVETTRVAVGDELGLTIRSSVANKFADKEERARHIHLDLEWTHIARREEARGVLPEIWGLAPMTEETKAMLLPPPGRRLEEDCPEEAGGAPPPLLILASMPPSPPYCTDFKTETDCLWAPETRCTWHQNVGGAGRRV